MSVTPHGYAAYGCPESLVSDLFAGSANAHVPADLRGSVVG
jgi:hypothetical protein